ncbi:MAG TPA: aspartate aminotransferase family protein [Candidatus Acidoferrum sp.]|nr:aspartate aminotransferase family protein [Candidatus Acidoferrum sp.]
MTATALAPASTDSYAKYVNPQWVALLDLLGLNVEYTRCLGAELFTADGRCIVDFLSGYCVHNTGHNHPDIIRAVKNELDECGPVMLQSNVPHLAGQLAERLCTLAGGGLTKVFFGSSGSEGVEAAIKFARASTGRAGLLAAKSSFHGLTAGALSLMTDAFWREGFGPLLEGTAAVSFGDLPALEAQLRTKRFAAFIVEPVQAEAGIVLPPADYLAAARRLCNETQTLLVLDEVQTGMFRTGKFLAAHHFAVQPDIVVLAKALSGGLVPVSAVLMKENIYDAVYNSLKRAIVHTSTFSENSLSMRAGLATLDVLERSDLGKRAELLGERFRAQLRHELSGYEMLKDVRGLGLLSGIEFQAPQKLTLKVAFESFRKIHPAMFGQIVVRKMFREKNFLTQICGNNFNVLKAAPPLVATEEHLDGFVKSLREIVDEMHTSMSFWSEALSLARNAIRI